MRQITRSLEPLKLIGICCVIVSCLGSRASADYVAEDKPYKGSLSYGIYGGLNFNGGGAVAADVLYGITNAVVVGADVRHFSFDGFDSKDNEYRGTTNTFMGVIELHHTYVNEWWGGAYKPWSFYFTLGAGVAKNSVDNSNDALGNPAVYSKSDTHPVYMVGGGMESFFTPNLAFLGEFSYLMNQVRDVRTTSGTENLDLNAALVIVGFRYHFHGF